MTHLRDPTRTGKKDLMVLILLKGEKKNKVGLKIPNIFHASIKWSLNQEQIPTIFIPL